jgi:hypothetical protein
MNLLNDFILGDKSPGSLVAEELKEAVSPVTVHIEELSVKLDRIENLLIQIDSSLKLLKPLATFLSKVPFLKSLK